MDKSVQITSIIMIGLVVIAVGGYLTISSFNPNYENTVSVSGQSTIEAVPDLVTVYFNVETKGATSEEANTNNSKIVDELITNLVKLGFERKDIQTQNFNIYPDYEWVNNKRVERGYVATHSIRLEMPTEQSDKIGQAIDAGVGAGAGISYINFELSQEKQNEYKAEAMKLAAQDARIKADAVAEGLGKEVGNLVSTSVNDFGYYPWNVYSARAGGIAEDVAIEAKTASTNITPSEQEISASVNAVFKLK